MKRKYKPVVRAFSLNEYVRFKPTEATKAAYAEHRRAMKQAIPQMAGYFNEEMLLDSDGFYHGQLWHVIALIAPQCVAGGRAAASTACSMYCDGIAHQHAVIRQHLAGRNLMCWCKLCPAHADGKPFGVTCNDCDPCHADVLGEIANFDQPSVGA